MSNLCLIFDGGIGKDKMLDALHNDGFLDFEDCLQMECAKAYRAEYIVTKDIYDNRTSEVKAILPSEYLSIAGFERGVLG